MTVSTVVDHNDYTGNGVTTSFPYTFRIFEKQDLTVTVSDLDDNVTTLYLDSGYTVTGAGSYSGGNVILPTPLTNGWRISIARELAATQETDLRNQGKFFAEVHEDAFDKLTMLIQQTVTLFSRALRKPTNAASWYDALNNRIKNLKDPSQPQDAVTLSYLEGYIEGGDSTLRPDITRTGAVGNSTQQAINLSSAGQKVLTMKDDEVVSSLSNDNGIEVEAVRGRIFNTAGVQLTTYSDPRSRFVTGEQYLHYALNKMVLADGFTPAKKTYILWSGDSTVVGVNSEAWPPAAIANQLARSYGIIDVQNTALGHSGKTLYEWGFFYIDTEWAVFDAADLIILRWGINDPFYGYTLEQAKAALDRGLTKLRTNKSVAQQSIIIMAPNATADTPNGRDEKWYEQLTAVMRAKAKQYQCMFFDTYAFYQDARRGAGVWLDNPYADGRGIHPDFTFSAQITTELMKHVYEPCAAVNGKTNILANTGSSVQTVQGSYPPSTFPLGVSIWRTDPTDSSWPVSGSVTVERSVDLISVQRLTGFTNDSQRITLTRFASGSGGWSQWRGLQITLSPLNGWTIGASRTATYQKSVEGVVTIGAILVAGTVTAGTIIANLPAEFRPKSDISYIACGTNTTLATVNILTNGNITVQSVPSGAVMSLSVSFPSFVL